MKYTVNFTDDTWQRRRQVVVDQTVSENCSSHFQLGAPITSEVLKPQDSYWQFLTHVDFGRCFILEMIGEFLH